MRLVYVVATIILTAEFAFAAEEQRIEVMLVHGQSISVDTTNVKVADRMVVDTASILKSVPGANVNANGMLTGIAQYRGLYGDRIAITIDDVELIAGCPNAMGPPLSYASPMLTEELVLHRGITGVSGALESMGGHINAKLARGDFGDNEDFTFSGMFNTRYGSNGELSSNAIRLMSANASHRVSLLAELDRGDDISTPKGDIFPSELSRDRFDLSYGYQTDGSSLLVYTGALDTENTGTPALPMDIRLIDTDMHGLQYRLDLSDKSQLYAKFSANEVVHRMDNFSMRTPPGNPMQFRQNYTVKEGTSFRLGGRYAADFADLNFGLDGKYAEHDATITNPNAAAFEIIHFNNIQRDVSGIYLELSKDTAGGNWELGIRHNRVATDADPVGATGMMGMMGTNAAILANAFNSAERDLEFDNTDVVAKYGKPLSENSKLVLEVGSKSRAPSYQELYLWLPLQSTGGLADGRNYIGNLDLDAEQSREINLGWDWSGRKGRIAPQIYFKRIDDYIQGTATTNMTANMLATMMSGAPALQFNNVEAEILGFDIAWNYIFSDAVFIEGAISYSDGKRTDKDDNLYRQSPNNSRIALNYTANQWHLKIESLLYAEQSDVAAFNNELPSSGYGLLNFHASWHPTENLTFEARIDNLGDKTYQDHLAGVNRVAGGEIAQGVRLFGPERSVVAGVKYAF